MDAHSQISLVDASAREGLPQVRQRRGRFPLQISERKLLLLIADLGCLHIALVVSLALSGPRPSATPEPVWILVLSGLWLLLASTLDLYDLRLASQTWHSAFVAGNVAGIVAIIYFLIPFVTPALPPSRWPWAVFVFLSIILVAAWRCLYTWLFVQPRFSHRVIIVGAGWAGLTIAQTMHQRLVNDYHVVGFADDDPKIKGNVVEGIPVLGGSAELVKRAEASELSQAVLAITHDISPEMFRALLFCQERGIEILPMPLLYEELTGKVAIEHIGQSLSLLLPHEHAPTRPIYLVLKRMMDLLSGVLGMALAGLAIPIVWVGNQLTSPGPLFYRQTRAGEGGRPFSLMKFRTMIPGAESETGAIWASEGDRRVTPMGRFMRKTRIDELPQFWNVFRGEMSLVGPRPERPEFIEQLERQIPFFRLRHSVRPGMTGWAQINYHYGNSVDDAKVKLQYDLYYIKNRSLYLEVLILLRTIGSVIRLQGT